MEGKRLLVISNSFPNQQNSYIGDIFVKEQLKFIKNYFDEVYVISPLFFGAKYIRHAEQKDYKFDNVHVFFPKYFNVPIFYFYGRRIWVKLAKNAVLKCIKENRISFDIIHAHYTWPSGAIAVELKKEFGTPVVITEHTHISLYKALNRKDRFYIDTWKKCDKIIRVNKKDVPLFKKYNNSVITIPNGFDPKKFYPLDKEKSRLELGLPRSKIILTVARLAKEKGHKYSIEAMKIVLKERKDVLYLVGGSGPLKTNLSRQINALGLQNYIRLVGFIPDDKINLWMNACDVFVLPSLSEGNPTVMFEVLACGKPFVGTKVGGIPEIITSEDYGLLCEPANPEDLAEKILVALEKEWDSEKIRKYAEQFSWENIAKKIVEVYKEVLERGGRC